MRKSVTETEPGPELEFGAEPEVQMKSVRSPMLRPQHS